MLAFKIHIPSLILGVLLGALSVFAQGLIMKNAHDFRADFIGGRGEGACRLEGFGASEPGDRGAIRWSYGPEASIQFFLPVPEMQRELILAYKLVSPIPGQDMEIVFNDKVVGRYPDLPASPDWSKWYGEAILLHPRLGVNTLSFRVSKWNGHLGSIAQDDKRPLALKFQELVLSPK